MADAFIGSRDCNLRTLIASCGDSACQGQCRFEDVSNPIAFVLHSSSHTDCSPCISTLQQSMPLQSEVKGHALKWLDTLVAWTETSLVLCPFKLSALCGGRQMQ